MIVAEPSDADPSRIESVLRELIKLSGASGALLRDESGEVICRCGSVPAWARAKLEGLFAAAIAALPHFPGGLALFVGAGITDAHACGIPGRPGQILVAFNNGQATAGMVALYTAEAARKLAEAAA